MAHVYPKNLAVKHRTPEVNCKNLQNLQLWNDHSQKEVDRVHHRKDIISLCNTLAAHKTRHSLNRWIKHCKKEILQAYLILESSKRLLGL